MIRFSKYIWIYILLSSAVIIPGLFSLVRYGLKPSIDFAGGTLIEFSVKPGIEQGIIMKYADSAGIQVSGLQRSGDGSYLLRTNDESSIKFNSMVELMNSEASAGATVARQDTVGPLLGSELLIKAVTAAVLAIIVILIYIAYAFRNITFGMAAIIALAHDLLVILGSFSLFGYFFGVEVDTLFVTAFLTTMSFSVHDTIVVFDRIREYQHKNLKLTFEEICDRALTETMGRSLANSLTIIFMLVALVLMGGSSMYWFTVALLIGTVSGTYSSDFVATPALILWYRLRKRKKSGT